MGVVVLYLSVSLLLSAPFGVALWRCLTRRPKEVPEEYAAYRRRPGLEEEVVVAELIVRTAYPRLADLYETPAPSGGVPR
ncbi:hypothetical protein [Streptomyces rubiginosohelvolus]|uniref:Uncharacterized protein n=1 Tax=Streptomyces rubiginosohelvolus TaxID=67362 RepID=A0ABQ3CCE5_9ACTN|nr:hypothetical protein [Streptomyces pluricolorescens]GGZ82536.1 hypothetical protein GCM10010328_66290 [Streptomyces pluricolorescens]